MGIDLKALLGGTLWVFGLAIILAAFSWAYYEAKLLRLRLRETLARPSILRTMDIGLALFCLGLAVASQRQLERALGFVLAIAWLVQLAWDFRPRGKNDFL